MDTVEQDLARREAEPRRGPRLPALSEELREAVRYAGLVFLSVRIGVGLLVVLGMGLVPANAQNQDGQLLDRFNQVQARGWAMFLGAWERWDAQWYLRIIDGGYPLDDIRAAFFPVYPMLSWVVRPLVGGSTLGAATLVANLSYLGALILLFRLTEVERDRAFAKRAVLYLAVAPMGFFLLAPYTEALFLLLALGVFWCARHQRWLPAGLLGALASGTRSVGFVLALPVAVEALQAARAAGDRRSAVRTLLAGLTGAALVPLGLLAYLGWWELRAGDGLFPIRLQETHWAHVRAWPWTTLWTGVRQGTTGIAEFSNGYPQLDLVLVAVALAGTVWALRRLPPSYGLWTLASVLLPLVTPTPFRVLISAPRYFVVVFPLTWAIARFAERFRAHDLVVAASAGLLGLLAVLHVTNYYVY